MSQGGYYSTIGLIYIQSKTVKIKDDFAFLCVSYLPRKLRQSKAISLRVFYPGIREYGYLYEGGKRRDS